MRKFNYSIIFLILSTAISQNIWNGGSVSNPDNLNATLINPAGLGINQGKLNGIHINIDTVYTYSSNYRSNGFGYNLTYNSASSIFNPLDGTIGIGSPIYNNTYIGFNWNKKGLIGMGFLYRPYNFLSFGTVLNTTDILKDLELINSTIGLSIRPLLSHRITLGLDYNITFDKCDDCSNTLYYNLNIEMLDGIYTALRWNATSNQDIQINLGFNLPNSTSYSSSNINTNDNSYSGSIGYYTSTQIKKSILKKDKTKKKHYIRIKFDDLFIEEKPYESPFNFDININPFSSSNNLVGTQLRTWIDKLDKLTNDPKIDGIIIDLKNVRAGFSKRGEIYSALTRFKKAGKKIIVYASKGISNSNYYLISMADKIFLNELTGIDLRGLKIEVNFYRGLLDTLQIVPEVFRVEYDGKSYKTAGDSYLNKQMSKEMRENYSDLLDDLYNIYLNGISKGRKWDTITTQKVINNGPYFKPEEAISAGLADSIMYPDQFEKYINSINNKNIMITNWDNIGSKKFYDYNWKIKKKEKIAIIYAVGGIVSGSSNPGPAGSSIMGDETIIKSIKEARKNKEIKGIILRIDSGGGSALASDQMWREVLKTTNLNEASSQLDSANVKPFISSMSDVAASGGYYIACQSDTIMATPATITGSIGVIGLRLNFSKLMKKWGITSDIIKKGDFSDLGTGNRLVSKAEREKIQGSINDTYEKFKNRVKEGRGISSDTNIDKIAMGRVFTGKKAKDNIEIPLVDLNGGIHDAIDLIKTMSGLDNQDVEIIEYPKPIDKFKNISTNLNGSSFILDKIQIFDIIPIIINDEIQMILPYDIKIN